ncbi:MAG: hypothetical protein HN348_19745 [Proteobacteria bacterium]|jgi:hypothetical protein|nr:hypothetical protein [Pseudomonadota bacterium]
MIPELKPRGIVAAAKQLGVEPFEVVRLLVASGRMPDTLVVSQEDLDAIRRVGEIESWWAGGLDRPDDANPLRATFRAALGQLLERECIGDKSTRMDNLWRGLSLEEQEKLQEGVHALIEEEVLATSNSEVGICVSVVEPAASTVRDIVEGSSDTPGLAAVFGGLNGSQTP